MRIGSPFSPNGGLHSARSDGAASPNGRYATRAGPLRNPNIH
jgi:hypothetical protein